ncbi:sulfurtransferase [Streptococcus bovimastitidis]|uniref:Sulfurtransferase n=1 Tax=Streptococcus bovimastitidis TaxID=1856638 RepID=A0A1L8MLK0_9STRE|nr:rhodanese-like domain-containing protein [Streptococcus bovimastitidis]OJF71606.1 sulfurtransferase [Streptococcus bovimastitidis]
MIFILFGKKQEFISTNQLATLMKEQSLELLDVRSPQEFQAGHIQGARNFPLNHIKTFKGNQKKTYYVICHSGLRSKRACQHLNTMGYQTVNVKGGMSRWQGPQITKKK